MATKTYLVRMRAPGGALQHVTASTVEIHDEHLIFCDSEGKLAALFLMEVVESWDEINDGSLQGSAKPRGCAAKFTASRTGRNSIAFGKLVWPISAFCFGPPLGR